MRRFRLPSMAQMSLRPIQEPTKPTEVPSAEAYEGPDEEEIIANRPSAPMRSREYQMDDPEHASRFDDAATNSSSDSEKGVKQVQTPVGGNNENNAQQPTNNGETDIEHVLGNRPEINTTQNVNPYIPKTSLGMDIGFISEELDAQQKALQNDKGNAGTPLSTSLSSHRNKYKNLVFDTFQRKRASLVLFVEKVQLYVRQTCASLNTFTKNSASKIRDYSRYSVTFLHESSTSAFWSVIYFIMTILFTMCGFLSKLPKYVPEPKHGTPGRQRLDNTVSQLLESKMLEEVHSVDKAQGSVDKPESESDKGSKEVDSKIGTVSEHVSGEQSMRRMQKDESSATVAVNRAISFSEPTRGEKSIIHKADGSKDTNMARKKETASPESRGNENGERTSTSSSSSSTSTSSSSNDQNEIRDNGSLAIAIGNDLGADSSPRNQGSDMYGSVDFYNRADFTNQDKSDDNKMQKGSSKQQNQLNEDLSSQTTRKKKGASKMRNSFTRKDSYTNYTDDITGQQTTTPEKESPGLFKGGKKTGQKGVRGIGAVKDSLSRVIGKLKNEHEATFTSPCAEKRTMIILSDVLVREFKANVAIRKAGPPKIRCEHKMSDNRMIRLSATFHSIDEKSTKVMINRSKNDDMSVSNKECLQFVSNVQKCMMDLLSEAGC